MHVRSRLGVTAAGMLVAATLGGTSSVATADTGWTATPVVAGLSAPRGIAFDGTGGMYVAQAGQAGNQEFGLTRSGMVSKYTLADGSATQQWATPFESVYMTGEGDGPEVLGPAGLSAMGPGCLQHGRSRNAACQVEMIMSLNHDEGVALTGQDVPQIGSLYRLNGQNGTATAISDFGDQSFAWTQDHQGLWEEFPDANPYGVLVTRDGPGRTRTFVADAGANTISEVLPGGTARVIAYIPNEGEDSGTTGNRDSTPTCIAQGPDGMLYVGTLDLLSNFDNGPGHSQVWKVDPNSTDWQHNATIWARGLTTITGCTFDQAGNFWAAEMFQPNDAGPPGDLAVVPFSDPTSIGHVGGGQLLLPGGVAQGPDGAMYVTTGSAAPNGAGGVMRVAMD